MYYSSVLAAAPIAGCCANLRLLGLPLSGCRGNYRLLWRFPAAAPEAGAARLPAAYAADDARHRPQAGGRRPILCQP